MHFRLMNKKQALCEVLEPPPRGPKGGCAPGPSTGSQLPAALAEPNPTDSHAVHTARPREVYLCRNRGEGCLHARTFRSRGLRGRRRARVAEGGGAVCEGAEPCRVPPPAARRPAVLVVSEPGLAGSGEAWRVCAAATCCVGWGRAHTGPVMGAPAGRAGLRSPRRGLRGTEVVFPRGGHRS